MSFVEDNLEDKKSVGKILYIGDWKVSAIEQKYLQRVLGVHIFSQEHYREFCRFSGAAMIYAVEFWGLDHPNSIVIAHLSALVQRSTPLYAKR